MATTMTYERGYMAHTTDGGMVTLPDAVAEDQKAYAVHSSEATVHGFEVIDRQGQMCRALLRGDLYGLFTGGTGDPIVELLD